MGLPLWWDPSPASAATPPPGRIGADAAVEVAGRADVVIVGGGYTGLWTALSLLQRDPALDVLVLEAEHVGFGASGRNGGWVSGLWPVSADTIAARHGRAAALGQLAALRDSVDEVGRVCAAEGIEAAYAKGGTLLLARGAAQAQRAQRYAAHDRDWGGDTVWLDEAATAERVRAAGASGSTYTTHCARVHPYRLVQGLADAVRRHGGIIVEGARVVDAGPGSVRLESGQVVAAAHIVRATEAWTARLPRLRRRLAPVWSLMVATEPLPARTWAAIGLEGRETFSDHGHVISYGQRTADDRIAFGGRGAPYHFASGIEPAFDTDERVHAGLRAALTTLFPALEGVRFTHAWGGPLGIARDWHPTVGYDERTGVGWAGGYVGDGVAASNLAGRTLADLILGVRSPLTQLPWVGHRSPPWEPEPLRWTGINAGLRLAAAADAEERRTGRRARTAYLLDRLTGG